MTFAMVTKTYPDVAIRPWPVRPLSSPGPAHKARTTLAAVGVYTKAFDIISNNETDLHYEYNGDPIDVPHMGGFDVNETGHPND